MASPGGYQINPGLYRVPDLLTEDQMVAYMQNTYGRTIEFVDDVEVNPARALGQTHPVGPINEVDEGKMSPNAVNDPVLRQLNNMDFRTPNEKRADERLIEGTDPEDQNKVDYVETEPGLYTNAEVSLEKDAEPIPVDQVDKTDTPKTGTSTSTKKSR